MQSSYKVQLNTTSYGELSDPLCNSVNIGLTLASLVNNRPTQATVLTHNQSISYEFSKFDDEVLPRHAYFKIWIWPRLISLLMKNLQWCYILNVLYVNKSFVSLHVFGYLYSSVPNKSHRQIVKYARLSIWTRPDMENRRTLPNLAERRCASAMTTKRSAILDGFHNPDRWEDRGLPSTWCSCQLHSY